MNIQRDMGGLDEEDGLVYDARFHCGDCGLCYSWPVTPGLAANVDPKQTVMLALVAAHTPAVCRAAQAAAVVELQKARAAEKAAEYDAYQDRIHVVTDVRLTAQEATEAEADGYPCPISGDPVVTVQDAINRGAIHVTRGLPVGAFVNRYGKRTPAITALAATQRRLMIGGVLPCRGEAGR